MDESTEDHDKSLFALGEIGSVFFDLSVQKIIVDSGLKINNWEIKDSLFVFLSISVFLYMSISLYI